MDKNTELKKFEQWLVILKLLTVASAIGTVVLLFLTVQGGNYVVPAILCFLCTVMFFMAHREKSNEPRPGSPEFEAIERAKTAKLEVYKERKYRNEHPFMVARELVKNNTASTVRSTKPENDTDDISTENKEGN